MIGVYINRCSSFLPNNPICNDDMETALGFVNEKPSRSKNIILRSNGIKQRYYAMDADGATTHDNAQMTAKAIRGLFDDDVYQLADIDLLSCGTSTPDQQIPSHAVMVHGQLNETGVIEVVSPAGVCCAGMHALKYAYMALRCGDKNLAISSGSERVAVMMRSDNFEEEVKKLNQLEENAILAFEKDFLRWMLSDGASAFLLSTKKNPNDISLHIDWLEGFSFAHKVEPCMHMGCEKMSDGRLKSYKDFRPEELLSQSVLSIKQDPKLLAKHIIDLGIESMLAALEKHDENIDSVTLFLPHISSYYFQPLTLQKVEEQGINLPIEKWFTNLRSKGNVGSASIYLMIEELLNTKQVSKGDRILLFVPESARFSYVIGMLTAC